MHPARVKCFGFTLIELIVAMVVVSIISGIVFDLILPHLTNYLLMRQRADLVDKADLALRIIGRDVRGALPNSLRIGTTSTGAPILEMLEVESAGVYRAKGANTTYCGASLDTVDFNIPGDSCFTSLASEQGWTLTWGQAEGVAPYDALNVNLKAGDWAVIYNLGSRDTNYSAYVLPTGSAVNRMTVSGASNVLGTGEFAINVSAATAGVNLRWAAESPQQRYQIVRYAVSYVCDPTTFLLTRYQYPVGNLPSGAGATLPTDVPSLWPALAGGVGSASTVADDVTNCKFIYNTSSTTNLALANIGTLYLSLTVAEPDVGNTINTAVNLDSVTLVHELHVSTVP